MHNHSVISQCAWAPIPASPRAGRAKGDRVLSTWANLGEGGQAASEQHRGGLLSCKGGTRGAPASQHPEEGEGTTRGARGEVEAWDGGMMGAAGRARRPGCGGWGEHRDVGGSVDWRQGQGCIRCVQPRLSGSPVDSGAKHLVSLSTMTIRAKGSRRKGRMGKPGRSA